MHNTHLYEVGIFSIYQLVTNFTLSKSCYKYLYDVGFTR